MSLLMRLEFPRTLIIITVAGCLGIKNVPRIKTLAFFFERRHHICVQLRDPKKDFIFNFDDKTKNLWTVWISCKINQHYSTPKKMRWANAHLNLCKLLETELRLAQRLTQLLQLGSAKFKQFKDFSFYHRSTSFERSSSSFNLAVPIN